MRRQPCSTAGLAIVALLAFGACSGPGGAAGPTPGVTQAASDPSEAAADPTACRPSGSATADDPAWEAGTRPGSLIPIPVSTVSVMGPSRFLYSLSDEESHIVASADTATRVRFFALGRDQGSPVSESDGIFLDAGSGRGLYRTNIDFDCWGLWGAEIEATLPDGTVTTSRVTFDVHPDSPEPDLGEPAPRSDTPTAATLDEVRGISTDPDPYPAAYTMTVGQAVTSGRPSLIMFATPAFCQTGLCGPTLDVVKDVARDYEGRVNFVNVEPYLLHETPNGLQPVLDASGLPQPVPAVVEYGLRTEPILFLVDATGVVAARFEGVIGDDELRDAVEGTLAG